MFKVIVAKELLYYNCQSCLLRFMKCSIRWYFFVVNRHVRSKCAWKLLQA